ncbi:MAG: dihydrofolate reductase [Planctomycetota bacterium]
MRFPLTAVVAVTPSGVIGRDGDMPWRLRQDLRRFKSLTMGGALVMGRKTYESIGRPLPGRRTIVVTRQPEWKSDGVEVAPSPERAVECVGETAGFVVGGAQIYEALLPKCDRVYLTRVWSSIEGDTRLQCDWADFSVREQQRIPAGSRDDVPTEFLILQRRQSGQNS